MANDIVETVPFTFDEIYSSMVEKLGDDAPYEGSNLATLLTSMTYLVSMLNVNTAANINEMLLPLARKRENILEGARLLGYEPSHKKSYRYTLTLTLKETISFENKILIEKYAKFTSGEKNYYYFGDEPIEIFGAFGSTFKIEVKEGTLYTFETDENLAYTIQGTYIVGNPVPVADSYIDIPYTDVEDDGIELYLSYTDSYANNRVDEKWTKTTQFMIDKDSIMNKVFLRKDDIDYNLPRLYFNYAGLGNTLTIGTIIKAYVLTSNGSKGYCGSEFTTEDSNLTSAVTISYELLSQGSDEESIQSIKDNAPIFFNSANRVITTMDYESFCNRQSTIKKSKIWGGDEEYPERPGEIWFTLMPSTYTRIFTASAGNVEFTLDNPNDTINNFIEKSDLLTETYTDVGEPINPGLWDLLESYKMPSLKYHNRNPVYLDCDYDISILKYSLTRSRADTNKAVFDIIDYYFSNTDGNEFLEKFNAEYFNSSLIKRIDNYLTDASGFNITMSNRVTLFVQNFHKEFENVNAANLDCYFQFALPFEDIFDANGMMLLVDRLPDITTENFMCGGVEDTLTVDWSPIISDTVTKWSNKTLITADIKHNEVVIGKYSVFNGIKKYISINLWAQDDIDSINPDTQLEDTPDGVYATSTLLRSAIQAMPLVVNIKFFSPNFKVRRNTIPRLNRVTFN